MALLFLVMLLSSFCFMILHANHDCVGHDCLVCEQIRICSEIFRRISHVAPLLSATLCIALLSVFTFLRHDRKNFENNSLVRLKVRLNN